MSPKPLGTFARLTLFFLPCAALFIALVAAIQLLHPRPAVVNVLAGVATLLVLAYSLFMGHQHSRGWDEVQKAGAGFANSNGWVWGGFATLALLAVPSIMNWAVDLVMKVPRVGPPDAHLAVRLGLGFGVTLVMVMQALAIVVASCLWSRRMRGP